MDPQSLTPSEWAEVGTALKFLWAALGLAVVAGLSLVSAHAVITSLVDTETISARWSRLRPPLYLAGIAAVIGLVVCLFLAVQNLSWLDTFYSRYWQ